MGSESKNGGGFSSPSSEWSPETKEMIQSLKEIVNCPESEIYAALMECNMEPNDTVQRLLSQDTFHEVKSKRERRKEMKEIQESRPQVNYSSSSTRGVRSTNERSIGWSGSIQTGYEEIGNVAHKGENTAAPSPPLPQLTSHVKGETFNQHLSSFNSDSLSTDSRGQSIGTGDINSSTVQPSPRCQPAWLGTSTGHLSMADIVRMGKSTSKSSHISSEASSHTHLDAATANSYNYYEKPFQVSASTQAESHNDLHSQNASSVSGMIYKSETTVGPNSFLDDQPVVEQPTAASGSSTLEASVVMDADMYSKHSNGDNSELSRNRHSHSIRAIEGDLSNGNPSLDSIVTSSASSGQESVISVVGDDSEPVSASNLSNPNYSATLSNDVAAVSSAAAKLQHLNLGEESENSRTVVLPSHLQALAADCSHLSFGTYKSGSNSASTALFPSDQSKDDREEAATVLNSLSAGPLETRNMGYAAEKSVESLYKTHKATTGATNYDLAAAFSSEVIKQDVSEATLGSEYIRPSLHESNVENIGHSTPELPFARTDPNFGNLTIQSQQAFMESTPNDLLMSKIQSLRESDNLQEYLAKQSITLRHGDTVSSMSFSEDRQPPGALSLSALSLAIPNQHRIAPSYSQPNLPLKQPTNNMIGGSALHQSYLQLPSTYQQQAFPTRDDLNQSLAGLKYSLPHYGASISRFPGASATAGYGSYGTSSNVLGNYLQTTSAPPMVGNGGYDGVFRPHHSDGDHFTSLQQNGSSSTWNHGPGSRMPPSAQEIAYYSSPGQNQQYTGYRQDQQQPSQYVGAALGYPDLYRSQQGVARDHQQQNSGGSTVGGSQNLLSRQMHQLWRRQH